jgi:hypothetical protein
MFADRTVRRIILNTLRGVSNRSSGRSSYNISHRQSEPNFKAQVLAAVAQMPPHSAADDKTEANAVRRETYFWQGMGGGCCTDSVHPQTDRTYNPDRLDKSGVEE